MALRVASKNIRLRLPVQALYDGSTRSEAEAALEVQLQQIFDAHKCSVGYLPGVVPADAPDFWMDGHEAAIREALAKGDVEVRKTRRFTLCVRISVPARLLLWVTKVRVCVKHKDGEIAAEQVVRWLRFRWASMREAQAAPNLTMKWFSRNEYDLHNCLRKPDGSPFGLHDLGVSASSCLAGLVTG